MVNELLTPAQVRAARAWLAWSPDELAAKAGVSPRSIRRYERGETLAYAHTLTKMRAAFEAAGIVFEFDGRAAKGIWFK